MSIIVTKRKSIGHGDLKNLNVNDHPQYLLKSGDSATGDFSFDSGTLKIDSINNRIGVNTTTPLLGLHVNGLLGLEANSNAVYPSNYSGTIKGAAGWNFGGDGAVDFWNTQSAGSKRGFSFKQQTAAATNSVLMTIQGDGNVGIGTTSPDEKLQVVGTAMFGGDTTNYSKFEADGTLVFNGTATVFDDLLGDITQVKTLGTGVSINTTESTIDFTTAANINDYAMVNYQITHAWKSGSNIYPHIHWNQRSSGVPNFLIQYRWQRNGQAKTTAWTNLKCNTNVFTYTSGTLNQIADGVSITPPSGYSISDIIQFRIIRDNANTSTVFTGVDTYSGNAEITGVDIHIEQDTVGSRTEYTK